MKSINEIKGSFSTYTPNSRRAVRSTQGISVGHSANLKTWQSDIVRRLAAHEDVFIVAAPSAGKTTPIVTYWAEHMLGLNPRLLTTANPDHTTFEQLQDSIGNLITQPRNIQKVLILCPTRALLEQTYKDFQERYVRILHQALRLMVEAGTNIGNAYSGNQQRTALRNYTILIRTLTDPDLIEHRGDNPNGRRQAERINQLIEQRNNIYNTLRDSREEKTNFDRYAVNLNRAGRQAGPNPPGTPTPQQYRNLYNQIPTVGAGPVRNVPGISRPPATPPHDIHQNLQNADAEIRKIDKELNDLWAPHLLDFINRNLICVRSGERGEEARHGNVIDAPVTIAIYESALRQFRLVPPGGFGLIFIDEAHYVQKVPDEIESRASQISSALYNILGALRGVNQTRIVFASGTINPTAARDLREYMNRAFARDFQVIDDIKETNPSHVEIIPANWLNEQNKLIDILVNPASPGNVIALFSKKAIERVVSAALQRYGSGSYSMSQVDQGVHSSRIRDIGYDEEPRELTRGIPLPSEKDILGTPGAVEIRNPILRQCVGLKFAFIFRQESEKDPFFIESMSQAERVRDNEIILDLFKQGKISTIIATDQLGVGMNISVRNFYIPDPSKYDPRVRENAPMLVSDLSQFLNRAGRGAFKLASIYTPEQHINAVANALNASNEDYETRISMKNLPISFHIFRGLWNRMWKINQNP